MKPQLHISADPAAVALNFANYLESLTKRKEKVSVALSGGSTPQLLFDLLASDFRDRMAWENIHFYWGDERCVAPDDKDSNFGMTKRHLFDLVDIPKKNIHRILGEKDPSGEAMMYGVELRQKLDLRNGLPVFDLVILGLGTDGHTASIFPHEMELLHHQEVCAVATHPESGQKRVTLTGPVINNASSVAFLVTGSSKREKVTEILQKTGSWKDYPASFISPAHGELHWFLDEAAAP